MRTLVFDLLQARAKAAGCADEAWDIIGEFAVAEALLDAVATPRDKSETDCAGTSYLPAAEALLSCLGARDDAEFDEDDDEEVDDEYDDLLSAEPRPSAFPDSN